MRYPSDGFIKGPPRFRPATNLPGGPRYLNEPQVPPGGLAVCSTRPVISFRLKGRDEMKRDPPARDRDAQSSIIKAPQLAARAKRPAGLK